mgnify:CR=1 FL=1
MVNIMSSPLAHPARLVSVTFALLALFAARSGAQAPLHVLVGHSDRVEGIAFSHDGKTLATAGPDRSFRLWDVVQGKALTFQTPDGPVPAVVDVGVAIEEVLFAPVPDADPLHLGARKGPAPSRLAVVGADRSVTLWDAKTGSILARHDGEAKPVHGVSFDARGRLMTTAAWDHRNAQRMWEVGTGVDRGASNVFVPMTRSISFTPEGATLALGDFNGKVRLRDVPRNAIKAEFQAHDDAVWCSTFYLDGSVLATGGGKGRVRFWDANDGRLLASLDAHAGGVRGLCFSPDGSKLATGGVDRTAKIWDVAAVLEAAESAPQGGEDAPPAGSP